MLLSYKGRLHQGQVNAFGQGYQCTIVALVALLVFTQFRHVDETGSIWTPPCIDNTVLDGSRLYDRVILSSNNPVPRYLAHNEIPDVINLWGNVFSLQVYEGLFYGIVGEHGNVHAQSVSIQNGLQNAFYISQTLLFTVSSETVSLFTDEQSYYLFDSHARNEQGLPDNHGTAVVLQFNSMHALINHILSTYTGHYFNISPVDIMSTVIHHQHQRTPISHVHPQSRPERTIINKNNSASVESADCLSCNNTCQHEEVVMEYVGNIPVNQSSHSQNMTEKSSAIYNSTIENQSISISQKSQDLILGSSDSSHYKNATSVEISNCHSCNKSCQHEVFMKDVDNMPIYQCVHSHDIMHNELNDRHIEQGIKISMPLNHTYCINNSNVVKDLDKHYTRAIQTRPVHSCECCQKFLFPEQVAHLKHSTTTSIAMNISVFSDLCSYCFKQIQAEHIPKFSVKFNLLDSGQIPDVLCSLNSIEKRLIALIQVFMTIIQLPGGQFAERGSVVNFMSPYIHIAKQLPSTENVIVVKFTEGSPTMQNVCHYISSCKIRTALAWLKQHNNLYKDILATDISCNTSASMNLSDSEESSTIPTNYTVPNVNVSEVANENHTIFLQKIQSAPVSPYGIISGEEMAFPWLFPYGINGYLSQHPMKITLREYLQLRLNNVAGVFRKDIPYLLNSVNVCDYQQLLSNISVHMIMRKPSCNNEAVKAKDVLNLKENPDLMKNSYMFISQTYTVKSC